MKARLERCKVWDGERNEVYLWCPGCNEYHSVCVDPGGWTWNGNEESPTINPSIKVSGYREKYGPGERTLCHSFVRDGRIQFLSDSAHSLAGQTVDLPDLDKEGL